MASASKVNKSAQLRCTCGKVCARRPGTSVQNREKFYLTCVNNEFSHAKCCQVFVGEHELDSYVKMRFAAAVELAEYHKERHEHVRGDFHDTVEELAEAQHEIRKLKRMNKTLQFSLAATAPVAATIAVASAWIAK